jgi:hypothetical protein
VETSQLVQYLLGLTTDDEVVFRKGHLTVKILKEYYTYKEHVGRVKEPTGRAIVSIYFDPRMIDSTREEFVFDHEGLDRATCSRPPFKLRLPESDHCFEPAKLQLDPQEYRKFLEWKYNRGEHLLKTIKDVVDTA